MNYLPLAERRTITRRTSPTTFEEVKAYCLGDFGAYRSFKLYLVVHLPSGMCVQAVWRKLNHALAFAAGLTKMKNTWSFIDAEELNRLRPDLIALAAETHAVEHKFNEGTQTKEPINSLNGYAQ